MYIFGPQLIWYFLILEKPALRAGLIKERGEENVKKQVEKNLKWKVGQSPNFSCLFYFMDPLN